jgi:hypothetical protein
VADQSSKLFFMVVSFVISMFFAVKSFWLPALVNVQDGRCKANANVIASPREEMEYPRRDRAGDTSLLQNGLRR